MADRSRTRASQTLPQESSKAPIIIVLLLLALAGLGIFGFMQLMRQQTATHQVVMDLKTETVNEIKDAAAGAAAGTPGAGAKVAAGIEELKTSLAAMQSEQKTLLKQIAALQAKAAPPPPMPAKPAPAPVPDGIPDPQNASIYFPLAVAKGPKVDSQIKDLMPAVKERAAKGDCRANVSGYSDTLGNDDANLRLSQKRADYVAEKLKAAGLTVGEVKAWGERRLEAFSVDGVQNESNRRVVIEVHCGPAAAKPQPTKPAMPKAEEKTPEPAALPAKPSS